MMRIVPPIALATALAACSGYGESPADDTAETTDQSAEVEADATESAPEETRDTRATAPEAAPPEGFDREMTVTPQPEHEAVITPNFTAAEVASREQAETP